MDKFYLATAIAYASSKSHIGNVYEIILADCIARYKKENNIDTFFQTGSDEHGQKIEQTASEKKIDTQRYVDEVSNVIKELYSNANINYDNFQRTSDEYHKQQVSKIYQKLYDQGDIFKGNYEGKYCEPCESFFTDSQITDNLCPDCNRSLIEAKEEAYFFKLSKYQDKLIKHINEHKDFIIPESRKNEMMNNFLSDKLPDLCVSRSTFSWGVELPFDKNHVSYVWIDALSNYLTGLGYDVDGNHDDKFKKYWPCDLHVVGKDIIRFHTIYWPILLMALDIELPKQIFGHPWILVGKDKMSKSLGNTIYSDEMIKLFGVDPVRYYLLHETSYNQDSILTYELFIERFNAELANTIGNLVSRTIGMVVKYFDGTVESIVNKKDNIDADVDKCYSNLIKTYKENMDIFRTSVASEEVLVFARRLNKYIDETEPWIMGKDENMKIRLKEVLYTLIEGIRIISILLKPFMPDTALKIMSQLHIEEQFLNDVKTFKKFNYKNQLTKVSPLFMRLDVNDFIK